MPGTKTKWDFDFYDSRNKIQKLLDDSQKLEFKDINLSEKLDDPLNRGDWAKWKFLTKNHRKWKFPQV
ncbi:MAG: hypothetical protein IPO04_14260 [Cytophagaceae bacterium]|nr:hypothetical protein [Cytophagaceae bacterium]